MHRRLQFGTRENTASSRQHASRLAAGPFAPTSEEYRGSTHEHRPSADTLSATGQTLDRPSLDSGARPTETKNKRVASTPHTRRKRSSVERPLTCQEAADLVRVHAKTVKRMARRGELPGHFRFGRWFFYASELDCWMRTEIHSSRHSRRQD
jgi:excisionase family DNA binding protein